MEAHLRRARAAGLGVCGALCGWLLTASGVSQTGSGAQAGSVESLFQRGATAMRSGHIAEAEQSFREAVAQAPKMADAHLDLGLVLGREGKTDEAIRELKTALELDPKIASGHMFLGIFLYQTGHAEEAIANLRGELALTPNNTEALSWLGIAELAAGRPEKAVAPLDRAAELDPDNLDVLEYRGRAHSQVAEASYARMAKISPDSWHVHRVRGEMLASEGKHADAIAEFEAAVKGDPRNSDLWEGLGDQYRASDQLEKAQAAFQKELDLSPANPIALYDLGSTDVERGQADAGVPLLRQMIAEHSPSAVAEYYLGRGLAEQGKSDEAAEWLRKSAAADAQGEVAKRSFYELARLYRKLGRTDEATAALAEYNKRRDVTDKDYNRLREGTDWRKLDAAQAAVAPASEGASPSPQR